jgi:hypothetical protein
VRRLRKTDPARVWRIEVRPGEEAQVDFGLGAPILSGDGRRRRTWVFRIVLSYSRKAYSEAVFHQDTETFIRCQATVADQRIHGTTKRQVAQLFAEEKARLLPLPASLFPVFHEARRLVHRDSYVEVAKAYYAVPPEYIAQQVWVRWDQREVRIFNARREQLHIHRRLEPGQFSKVLGIGGGQGSLQANLDYWLRRAGGLGSDCQTWARTLVQNRGIEGMRSLMGLVSLSERHSFRAINQACARAQAKGTWRLRDVRALLDSGEIQTELALTAKHPLIRDLSEYGIFIKAQNL